MLFRTPFPATIGPTLWIIVWMRSYLCHGSSTTLISGPGAHQGRVHGLFQVCKGKLDRTDHILCHPCPTSGGLCIVAATSQSSRIIEASTTVPTSLSSEKDQLSHRQNSSTRPAPSIVLLREAFSFPMSQCVFSALSPFAVHASFMEASMACRMRSSSDIRSLDPLPRLVPVFAPAGLFSVLAFFAAGSPPF